MPNQRKSTAGKGKRRRGRPPVGERERMVTETVTLNWYEIRALELEAEKEGVPQKDLRRKKLLAGITKTVKRLKAADGLA